MRFPKIDRMDVVIVVVTIATMIAAMYLPFKAKPFGDNFFHEEAKALAAFCKGNSDYEHVIITKAPGPDLFFGAAYALAPSNASDHTLWIYGVCANAIALIAGLLLLYRSAQKMFSKKIAFLSIVLALVFPVHCYYALSINAEVPAFSAFAVAFYGWSTAFLQPQKKRGYIWLAAGLVLLAMFRPNTMLFPVIGIAVAIFAYFKNKEFYKRYGKRLLVCLAGVIAIGVAITQGVALVNRGKDIVDQQVYFYYVAHEGRFQFREEPLDWRYWQDDTRPDSKDYQNWVVSGESIRKTAHEQNVDVKKMYRDFLVQDVLDHPFWFARSFVMKGLYSNTFFANSVSPQKFKLGFLKGPSGFWSLMLIINIVNILILVGSLAFLIRARDRVQYWPLWGIWAALLLFHGATYMEPRYLFPARAAMFVMGAAGLYGFGMTRVAADCLYNKCYRQR